MSSEKTVRFSLGNFIIETEDASKLVQELSPTKEDRTELDCAKTMPIIFDEDRPETTPEHALRFGRVNPTQ